MRVTMRYDQKNNLLRNLDLAHFPYKKTVHTEHLSSLQQRTISLYNRNISKENGKLISECSHDTFHYADFIENILYMQLYHGAIIVEIIEIIMFNSFDYMKSYSNFLQECRGKTPSKVVNKLVKNLGNNIPGILK